jgi:predicted secreted acid phosphatase
MPHWFNAAWLFFLSGLGGATWSGGLALGEPPNLGEAKAAVREYIDSGAYERDLAQQYAQVQAFCLANVEGVAKPAVVMDIDETTLSNYAFSDRLDFGYTPKLWREWVLEEQAKAITPAKAFFDWCRQQKIAVFFVTGRKSLQELRGEEPTEKNLAKEGFNGYERVYFKPRGAKDTAEYKAGARREIESMGFVILANVGDQQSDLQGGHALSHWKLPNPMYVVH